MTENNNSSPDDWEPKSGAVQGDQRAAQDRMRERCPVACNHFLG